MENSIKKLHSAGSDKYMKREEKRNIIREALDLGFPFRETLEKSKTTYPEYIEMFYPEDNLETRRLIYNNETHIGFELGYFVDLIDEEGVYALQYKITDELGFYSERCYILFYDGCYRFIDESEAERYSRKFWLHRQIYRALQK